MGIEIERKFLVDGDSWRGQVEGASIRQGYLSTAPVSTVRIRAIAERAYLTIKGLSAGAARAEFEYEIPVADATELLAMCTGPLVEKTRYRLAAPDVVWEIDEFHGDNAGLIMAECELSSEMQSFTHPDWLGKEVTEDPRYYNSYLSQHPFTSW